MNEKPIIFSASMVRAILNGTKTQTRRIAKVTTALCKDGFISPLAGHTPRRIADHLSYCPLGKVGDILWVREAHALVPESAYRCSDGVEQKINPNDMYEAAIYKEGCDRSGWIKWRPSIHMHRWASRITLEIIGVRLERLNDISEEDSIAEGITVGTGDFSGCYWYGDNKSGVSAKDCFAKLWESINGNGSLKKNPFVWVISFRRI